MTPAHAIALALLPFATLGSCVLALIIPRYRDAAFFILVAGATVSERMDVHFISEAWYRGTTRGFEFSVLSILAFSLLVGCLIGRGAPRPRWFWPAGLGVVLLYASYALLSVCISTPKLFGAFELLKVGESLVVFLAAAVYLRGKREWQILLLALAFSVSLEGVWAIKQKLITHVDRPPGSLDHANSLSMYLCLTCPLLVAAAHKAWNRWMRRICAVALAIGTVGVVLTLSRTGVPVFVLCATGVTLACASFVPHPKRLAVAAVIAGCLISVVAATWKQLGARYESASLQEEYFDASDEGRGVYLRLARAIVEDHPLGVGLNNWSYYVSRIYGPRLGFRYADYDYMLSVYGPSDDAFSDAYLPAPAHNLAALTTGELGIPGLIIFVLIWLRWLGLGLPFVFRGRKDAAGMMGAGLFFCICGIFGQSLTEWVFRQTPILFTFYVLMGALAAVVHAHRTHPEKV